MQYKCTETSDNNVLIKCQHTEQRQHYNLTHTLSSLSRKTIETSYNSLLFVKEWSDGSKEYFHEQISIKIAENGETINRTYGVYHDCRYLYNIMTFDSSYIVVLKSRDGIDIYDTNMKKILSCEEFSNFYIDNDLLVCTDIACLNDIKIYDRFLNCVQTIKFNGRRYNYIIKTDSYNFFAYDIMRECVDVIDENGRIQNRVSESIRFLTYGNKQIKFANVKAFFRLECGNILIINNNTDLFVVKAKEKHGSFYFDVILFHKLNQCVRTVKNIGNNCFDIYYDNIGARCLKIEHFRYSIMENETEIVVDTDVDTAVDTV